MLRPPGHACAKQNGPELVALVWFREVYDLRFPCEFERRDSAIRDHFVVNCVILNFFNLHQSQLHQRGHCAGQLTDRRRFQVNTHLGRNPADGQVSGSRSGAEEVVNERMCNAAPDDLEVEQQRDLFHQLIGFDCTPKLEMGEEELVDQLCSENLRRPNESVQFRDLNTRGGRPFRFAKHGQGRQTALGQELSHVEFRDGSHGGRGSGCWKHLYVRRFGGDPHRSIYPPHSLCLGYL